jgi:predicted dehydrogenase
MTDKRELPLKGAIVGFGFIAERGHFPAYAALGQGRYDIVAVADVCEARRAAAHKAIPGARIYESYQALLANEGDKLDFVDVTTPPACHGEIAHAALGRGLHVLCEKPLTTSSQDARRLVRRARTVRRVLYPGHNYKHAPVIRRVREVLSSGQIGDVRMVTLNTFRTTHARGVAEWRPDWRREHVHSGGGIAMDHGSHTFYLAFEWLGAYPTAIASTNISCAIKFPTGMANAHLAWTAGTRKVIYSIHGRLGAIRIEDDEIEVTTRGEHGPMVTRESVSSNWADASHSVWFRYLFEDFEAAIERHDYAGREAEDAVRCVELIEAAYASARKAGREVQLGARGNTEEVLSPTGTI